MQDNVSSVMEQMDTLFLLKDKFEEDMKKHNTDTTTKIEKAINGLHKIIYRYSA